MAKARKRAKKATRKKATTKPGRPAGSPNVDVQTVRVMPSACPKCASTERGEYTRAHSKAITGRDTDTGRIYNRVTWRHTKCKACGQARIDKAYEYDTVAGEAHEKRQSAIHKANTATAIKAAKSSRKEAQEE